MKPQALEPCSMTLESQTTPLHVAMKHAVLLSHHQFARADPYTIMWVRPHPASNAKYVIVFKFPSYTHPHRPNICTHSTPALLDAVRAASCLHLGVEV